jgi:hypothetical protein
VHFLRPNENQHKHPVPQKLPLSILFDTGWLDAEQWRNGRTQGLHHLLFVASEKGWHVFFFLWFICLDCMRPWHNYRNPFLASWPPSSTKPSVIDKAKEKKQRTRQLLLHAATYGHLLLLPLPLHGLPHSCLRLRQARLYMYTTRPQRVGSPCVQEHSHVDISSGIATHHSILFLCASTLLLGLN